MVLNSAGWFGTNVACDLLFPARRFPRCFLLLQPKTGSVGGIQGEQVSGLSDGVRHGRWGQLVERRLAGAGGPSIFFLVEAV